MKVLYLLKRAQLKKKIFNYKSTDKKCFKILSLNKFASLRTSFLNRNH